MEIKKCSKMKSKVESTSFKIKKYLETVDDRTKLKFWIKTLLSASSSFPEIIKTIDKIIEIQASSTSFSTTVFNGPNSLLDQVERMIDLSDRKATLINIYVLSKDMLKDLPEDDLTLIKKRFVYGWSSEDLAKTYNLSVRTIYRKIDKIIDKIEENIRARNWTLKFVELQVDKETWLHQRYFKVVEEYLKNSNQKRETDEKSNLENDKKILKGDSEKPSFDKNKITAC